MSPNLDCYDFSNDFPSAVGKKVIKTNERNCKNSEWAGFWAIILILCHRHRWMFCYLEHFCANEINRLNALSTLVAALPKLPRSARLCTVHVVIEWMHVIYLFIFFISTAAIDLVCGLYWCLHFPLPCDEQNERHSKSITNRIKMVAQTTCG